MARLPFELKGKSVFVAGHRGMVGSALVRRLAQEDVELLTIEPRRARSARSGRGIRLVRRQASRKPCSWRRQRSAASSPTTRCAPNSSTTTSPSRANVIHAAHVNGTEKLMFLGSSCIYPKLAAQPLREDSMLTGPLEPTNEPYAIAKIAGIKMVEAYRSQYGSDFINVMPTNLYGRGDNYHPEYSHVVAALIRRFHEAKVSGREERRGLGHRHAAAGISVRRRSCRRLHPSDEDLFLRRTRQYRHRRGHHDRGIRARGCGCRRLYRRDQL